MSVRAFLALAVFVAVGALVLFILISRGIIEPETTKEEIRVSALYVSPSVESGPSEPSVTPAPSPAPVPDDPIDKEEESAGAVVLLSDFAVLSPGDDNQSVLRLQQRLIELGYMEPDEPSTLYNSSIASAVGLFQRASGLEMTGTADAELQSLLFSDAAHAYRILPGDSGDDVSAVQQRLKELGYYSGRTTGYFGPQTEEAVKLFEYQNGLEQDGTLDLTDWKRLYSYQAGYNLFPGSEDTSSGQGSSADLIYPHSGDGLSHAASDQADKPYVWGKDGPDAFDCSGLICYCLRLCGISISKTEPAGFSQIEGWQKIDKTTFIKRGDILFFKSDAGDEITHAGISIGTSYFVHASSSSGKVTVSSLSDAYWSRNFVFARRVFNG